MEGDKNNLKNELAEHLSKLAETPCPRGFVLACEDIDIDIYEYEGYLVGLADSYLSGSKLNRTEVDQGKDLCRRLSKCETKLQDLRAYLDSLTQIATLLMRCLESNT